MIILQCLFIHFIECFHDRAQINAAGPNAEKLWVSAWLQWDTVLWTLIYLRIALSTGDFTWIVAAIIARLFMLQIVLNYLRKLPITHLGTNPIDVVFLRLFGKRGTIYFKSLLVLAVLAYEIIQNYDFRIL